MFREALAKADSALGKRASIVACRSRIVRPCRRRRRRSRPRLGEESLLVVDQCGLDVRGASSMPNK